MSAILLRTLPGFSPLNRFQPALFKIFYSDSAVVEAKPKLKALIEEDFSRIEKKSFKKHFVENLFINKIQNDILEYPQMDTLDEYETLRKHYFYAYQLLTDEINERDKKKYENENQLTLNAVDSKQAVSVLKKHELIGFKVSRFKNGFGYLNTEYMLMQEALSLNPSLSKSVHMQEDFGILLIDSYGSDFQKGQYLPHLLSGEKIACFAHLEPGTVVSLEQNSFNTSATLSSDCQSYSISGEKNWVYNPNCADVFIVSANVKSSNDELPKPTLFLVDKNLPGVVIHQPIRTIGLKNLSICNVTFNNVTVPTTSILGNICEGNKIINTTLSKGVLNNGSHCIGIMRKIIDEAITHCIYNKFFNKDKYEYDYYKIKIGEIVSQLYAVESITYLLTGRIDSHTDPDVYLESLIVKIFSSESLQYVVQEVKNILGPEVLKNESLIQLFEDSLFYTVCEDSNDYLRLILSSAGIKHAIANNNLIFKYQDYKQKLQNFFMPQSPFIYRDDLEGYLHQMFSSESKLLENAVYCLHLCTSYLINKYGDEVFERQLELTHLADILINSYALFAILGRASRAYCLGSKWHDMDQFCAEFLSILSFMIVEKKKSLITEPLVQSFNMAQIGSSIAEKVKYSNVFSVARNLKVQS